MESNFVQYIKDNEDRIVIFGIKSEGVRVYNTLKKHNIKPGLFCDNNSEKSGGGGTK